jgi:hypothetical protein
LNPHPTDIIEVSGVVADGGSYPRHLDVDIPVIQSAGQLTARLAGDRYARACGWRLWTIAAVIRDEDRAVIHEVIASAAVTTVGLKRPATGIPLDLTIACCGYPIALFSCGGASVGDKRYLPVIFDAAHRDVSLEYRLGRYPPPDYRPPCTRLDGRLSNAPCPVTGYERCTPWMGRSLPKSRDLSWVRNA